MTKVNEEPEKFGAPLNLLRAAAAMKNSARRQPSRILSAPAGKASAARRRGLLQSNHSAEGSDTEVS